MPPVRTVLLTYKMFLPEIYRCGKERKTQTNLRPEPRGKPTLGSDFLLIVYPLGGFDFVELTLKAQLFFSK